MPTWNGASSPLRRNDKRTLHQWDRGPAILAACRAVMNRKAPILFGWTGPSSGGEKAGSDRPKPGMRHRPRRSAAGCCPAMPKSARGVSPSRAGPRCKKGGGYRPGWTCAAGEEGGHCQRSRSRGNRAATTRGKNSASGHPGLCPAAAKAALRRSTGRGRGRQCRAVPGRAADGCAGGRPATKKRGAKNKPFLV